jgi:omega-6 fatty acid desaturase (delta-12 desaturase)
VLTATHSPHYNAWDAREALKPVLGKYYKFDDTPVFKALYDNYRACRFVDDEGDVIFYRDTKGKVACRVAYDSPVSDSGVDVKQ